MLYLTFEDNPFPEQKYDENELLEFVRSVARRDGDDRTVSELLRFQESLERLGLLWTPFDSLDSYQAHEFVRNLHLELTAPGDMVYLKHSPAMRCYVVLRGTVLLTNNVLDREGINGVRTLGPGREFGHALDPDLEHDQPVTNFLEYAKVPHLDLIHEGGGEVANATHGGSRKDGRAELLVIGRQDWISTLQASRSNFASIVTKDITTTKSPDLFKSEARVAFNFPAKGRKGVHHEIATKYLKERVPFCADLPPEQVSALASAVELQGLAVPGRVIFKRGRECDGDAYIMFTGTADQKGGDKLGDRLIKEGDLFGDEFFAVAVKDVSGTPFRTATAITRTAPSELLIIPSRECRRLQAFVAIRNSEKAMAIFEKFFINLPREVCSEIAKLATFRTIKMHAKLAEAGDDVWAVFFVFRGECVSQNSKHDHQQHAKRGQETRPQRYGPGHIIGWPFIMSETAALRRNPMSANDGVRTAAASRRPGADVLGEEETRKAKQSNKRRPRRNVKLWRDNVTVTTPAQMLSVPLVALRNFLSQEALEGLRAYITQTHKHKLEDASLGAFSDDDSNEHDFRSVENGLGWSNFSSGGYVPTGLFGAAAGGGNGQYQQCDPSRFSPMGSRRPLTAPEMALKKQGLAPLPGYKNDRPRTTSLGERFGEDWVAGTANPFRPNTRTRWRWRVGLTGAAADASASMAGTPCITASRGGRSSRQSSPNSPSAIWGYGGGSGEREIRRTRRGSGLCCSCPMESCRGCSSSKRLERLRNTPVWAPILPSRSTTPASAPAALVGRARSGGGGAISNISTLNAFSALSAEGRPSTFGSATTAFVYKHRREDKASSFHQPGRDVIRTNALEGEASASAGLSFKLWSEGRGSGGCGIDGGGGGALTMTTANRGNTEEDGHSSLGTPLGEACHVTICNAGHFVASSSPVLASHEGTGVEGVTIKTVVAAPTSDFGVTDAVRQLGGGSVRAGDVEATASSAASIAASVLPEPDRPIGRLSYTLVQLSTRAALVPSFETSPSPSSASAAPCLSIRILGSFACETEATTRVLNLYHSVLPVNLTWLPCQGTAGGPDILSSSFSDHLFLLRKGVSFGRLSFNVGETSENGDKIIDIDDGNNSESNTDNLAKNTSNTSTDTSSNDNSTNSIGSKSTNINNDNDDNNSTPKIAGEGVGRGYDAHIPAVFKAKGQHFAVVFALSPDQVEMKWAKQQQQQQEEEHRKQLLESKKRVQDTHRSRGTESAELSATLRHGSRSSSCSSRSSALQPGRYSPPTEGHDDGELTLGDTAERAGLNDGCSTSGEAPTQESEAPASDFEVPADVAVDQGESQDPTASCDISHTSLRRECTEPEDEACKATATQAGEGCDGRVRGDKPFAVTIGDGEVVGGAKQGPFPGSFFDELLDKSDSESSRDDGGNSRWIGDRSTGGGTGSLEGSAGEDAGSGGMNIGPDHSALEKRSVLSWIIGRMGLLEKVEGCYETEVKAFKKAVEILEGKETALSGTRRPCGSSHLETGGTNKERAMEGGGGAGGGGDGIADLDKGRASWGRHPEQQRPRLSPAANPVHENLACILPLYEWLSLGDGGIGAVETAIQNRSISDPSEAKRAGVDPFALWTEQRTRRLRTNLYNLLTAAGPREIQSRCGVATTEDGRRGGRGRRVGVHREGGRGGGMLVDEENAEKRAFRNIGRKTTAKTAVRSARAAVLRQNQKLIQTEMNARQRMFKATGTQAIATGSKPDASIRKQGGGGGSSAITRSPEKPAIVDDSGSADGKGAWFRAGGGRGGGCGLEKKGLRHELRLQMKIERKRARLFEDIQTLPYTGTTGGIVGAKGNSSGNNKGNRNRDGSGNKRPIDAGHQGSSSSTAPPAIVLRAPKVQAQKRLHGKPASSFFARAHAAGVTLSPQEGTVLDEPSSSSPKVPDVDSVASPNTTEEQPASDSKATAIERLSAANLVVKPHPTPPAALAESVASAVSTVSLVSNASTSMSVYESCTSTVSDGHETASTSMLEATLGSASSSRNNQEGRVLDCTSTHSKPGSAARSATKSRGTKNRAGYKGVGRKAVKGEDGVSTSRVPALHGELMLLDGCLHDHNVRTWVENTLVPAKKHQQRVV